MALDLTKLSFDELCILLHASQLILDKGRSEGTLYLYAGKLVAQIKAEGLRRDDLFALRGKKCL